MNVKDKLFLETHCGGKALRLLAATQGAEPVRVRFENGAEMAGVVVRADCAGCWKRYFEIVIGEVPVAYYWFDSLEPMTAQGLKHFFEYHVEYHDRMIPSLKLLTSKDVRKALRRAVAWRAARQRGVIPVELVDRQGLHYVAALEQGSYS